MNKRPIQGEVQILSVATETGISSVLVGHLARMQTLLYTYLYIFVISDDMHSICTHGMSDYQGPVNERERLKKE